MPLTQNAFLNNNSGFVCFALFARITFETPSFLGIGERLSLMYFFSFFSTDASYELHLTIRKYDAKGKLPRTVSLTSRRSHNTFLAVGAWLAHALLAQFTYTALFHWRRFVAEE